MISFSARLEKLRLLSAGAFMVYSGPKRGFEVTFFSWSKPSGSGPGSPKWTQGRTPGNIGKKTRRSIVAAVVLLSIASVAGAQTFGQFTTARPSAEGEGSLFMVAGNDAFRTGATGRFNLSDAADFGLELGLDRVCDESFLGGGVDFKLVLLRDTPELPLSLALDASFGALFSDAVGRYPFDFGILASGVIAPSSFWEIEPYASFVVQVERRDKRSSSASCLCPHGSETDTDTFVRAGVRFGVTDETQVIFEADLGETSLFGAAFNVIF
jgi:hypothetical protein